MALIKCPDCGKEFSDAAAACPQCGRPHTPVAPPSAKKTSPLAMGCLVLIVLGVISSIATKSTPKSAEQAAREEQDVRDFSLKSAAQTAVKSALRDPESADFKDVVVVHKDSMTTVCGSVNAKNGFGGFTGYTEFLAYGATIMVRSDDNASVFVRRWNRRCAAK